MTIYYAIGDIHGHFEAMIELHNAIEEHHQFFFKGQRKVIVHLGDHVDRGPDSASVVEALRALEGEDFVVLKGNHEDMMFDGCMGEQTMWWRGHGGEQTLNSYYDRGTYPPPAEDLKWMVSRPTYWHLPDEKLFFVHAAIDTEAFPDVSRREVHLWGRSESFFRSERWTNPALEGYRVVHGHTPTSSGTPEVSADGRRINVDTGAGTGGPLSAAVIAPDGPVRFLSVPTT